MHVSSDDVGDILTGWRHHPTDITDNQRHIISRPQGRHVSVHVIYMA